MSKADVYLYVQMDDQLWRLNITKLGEESSSPPEFQPVFVNSDGDLPIGMGCIYVGSKLYMMGGQKEQITNDDNTEFDYVPNLNVFVLYLDGGPSIRICEGFPRMLGPKFNPLVVTLDAKFYVLARRPFYKYDKALEPPVFEVFDPVRGSWKDLPSPPWTDPNHDKLGGDSMYHHFVWAHKIVFCTQAGFYIFDARTEEWTYADKGSSPFPIISCAVEFEGFLIAMPWDCQELVAYQLDSDGIIPKSYRVLDELSEMFNPPFVRRYFQGFLIHLGDGDGGRKMCFLYAGLDYSSRWCARVANFRVFNSCNDAGDMFPHAKLETLQHYDLEKFDVPARWIDSAFVMCDYLNKHDVEADASLMDACLSGSNECVYLNKLNIEVDGSFIRAGLSGSYGCDYLNKHDVDADASFKDAYLSGSNREFDSSTTAGGLGQGVYFFAVGLLISFVQLKFQNKAVTPFETHPVSMRAFCISICTYALAVLFREFVHRQTISGKYSRIVSHVILISVALSEVSLVSLFISNWLSWLLYISWLIFCVMVLRWNFIHLINQAVVFREFVQRQTISGKYSRIVSLVIEISVALSAVPLVFPFVPNWFSWLLSISGHIFSVLVLGWNFIHLIKQWLCQRTVNAFLQDW